MMIYKDVFRPKHCRQEMVVFLITCGRIAQIVFEYKPREPSTNMSIGLYMIVLCFGANMLHNPKGRSQKKNGESCENPGPRLSSWLATADHSPRPQAVAWLWPIFMGQVIPLTKMMA